MATADKKERKPHPKTKADRNARIWHAIKVEKKSGEAVAKDEDITRGRVSQIIKAMEKKAAKAEKKADAISAMPDAVLPAHHSAPID